MRTEWQLVDPTGVYDGREWKTKELKWTAARVDLISGSHSQQRALVEVYASSDSKEKFAKDFVAAWHKVMNLDRYDLASSTHRMNSRQRGGSLLFTWIFPIPHPVRLPANKFQLPVSK